MIERSRFAKLRLPDMNGNFWHWIRKTRELDSDTKVARRYLLGFCSVAFLVLLADGTRTTSLLGGEIETEHALVGILIILIINLAQMIANFYQISYKTDDRDQENLASWMAQRVASIEQVHAQNFDLFERFSNGVNAGLSKTEWFEFLRDEQRSLLNNLRELNKEMQQGTSKVAGNEESSIKAKIESAISSIESKKIENIDFVVKEYLQKYSEIIDQHKNSKGANRYGCEIRRKRSKMDHVLPFSSRCNKILHRYNSSGCAVCDIDWLHITQNRLVELLVDDPAVGVIVTRWKND